MKRALSSLLVLVLASASLHAGDEEKVFQMPRATPTQPTAEVSPPTILDSYEFNGFMKLGGQVRVSVTDTKTKKSYWLTQDGPSVDGMRLQKFMKNGDTIIIASGGAIKQLELKKPKIQTIKVVDQPVNAAPVIAAGGVVAPPPNVQPTETDDEVRIRMQKVAEEIRRRRAERRAMMEQRQQQGASQ